MKDLIRIPSRFGPQETMDRLEAEIRALALTVFARIDHAAGAADAGMELMPTAVIIFGNARAGTPLMQLDQVIGLDLPLKALVWRDSADVTWIAYGNPLSFAQQLARSSEVDRIVSRMSVTLDAVSRKAAGEQH